MFDERYAYASARIKALEKNLLSETQVERLLSAASVADAFRVLQDTFLAPYLAEHEKSSLPRALETSINDAKGLITSLAPDPEIFDALWIKYDFLNLHTIIKGKRLNMSDEEIAEKCFSAGKYSPAELVASYNTGRLEYLNPFFKSAVKRAENAEHVYDIDIAMNTAYFDSLKELSARKDDTFLSEYIALLIDLFNLKVALRAPALKELNIEPIFIEGGQFSKKSLETPEQALAFFSRFGGDHHWRDAIKEYTETGDHSLIGKISDEYVADFFKNKSTDVFSAATLFGYFTAKKNNVQLVGSIMTEKEAGLKEGDIRYIFRKLYV